MVQLQSALPNTGMFGPLRRGPRSVLVNLLAGFAFPAVAVPGARFPSRPERAKHCALRLRNLDTKQPFSYCYELPTQHRLESVATRTPPPICTSALGFSYRAGLESLGRREP